MPQARPALATPLSVGIDVPRKPLTTLLTHVEGALFAINLM